MYSDSGIGFLDPVAKKIRLTFSPSRIDRLHAAAERHQMIAEAAYMIAERRGFAPGNELADWLAAEREVNRACGLMQHGPIWDD
jgi:Protein of unknown function (DUF2934)